MATIIDYNLAVVQVTVGTFRVTGWGPDDALTITWADDLIEATPSADGSHVAISAKNNPMAEAVLKVKRGSVPYRLLAEALQGQQAEMAVGAVAALAFQVYDPTSGDKVVESQSRFMRQPDMPFAKSASDAEFKILLPSSTATYGANITTS